MHLPSRLLFERSALQIKLFNQVAIPITVDRKFCSKQGLILYAYSKCSKISITFSLLHFFSNKIAVFRAGIQKIIVRITDRKNPDQTASFDLGLCCLSSPFWKAASVRNFIILTASAEIPSLICCLFFKCQLLQISIAFDHFALRMA